MRSQLLAATVILGALPAGARAQDSGDSTRWCDLLPRPPYRTLERVSVPGGWFEAYRVDPGVFALYEPLQFQEVISYLVLGEQRALLFDTGLGIGRIAEVVKVLTPLPVTVLNSHTHFDHVGGNADFERVLALDTEYTRANTRGFPHEAVAGEVTPEALCAGLPAGFVAAQYRTRPYAPQEFIRDGHEVDLGGRRLTVLHIPGHTPDAVAVLDRAHGLLFTGDSFYEGPIWLTAPETDLPAYGRSVERLAELAPGLRKVFPAHNVAVADPRRLVELRDAMIEVRSGRGKGTEKGSGRVEFVFEGFSILTSMKALGGAPVDSKRGGSGLGDPDPEP
jgi:glyoxylase-like metal-dependent hydrolase (beta-lactamase superfamily II)